MFSRWRTRPRATTASVPGAQASQRSALAPVSVWNGLTKKKKPFSAPRAACMALNFQAYSTGDSQVSRNSAPKETRHVGFVQAVGHQAVDAEDFAVGSLERFIGEGLEDDGRRRIPVLERRPEELHLAFADHLGQKPHPVGTPAGGLPGFGLEKGLCSVEADGYKPVLFLQQRCFQPVRVVDGLQGGLAAHAELAAVEGVQGVALDLDHAPFAVLGDDAAAGRALPAGRGIPGGLAGHHVFRGLDQAVEIFRGLGAATGREGNAAQAG